MRDGPHRTLPLPRDWKGAAERLDNENCSIAEICDALCRAVQGDWQSDVTPAFLSRLLRILQAPQPDMHRSMANQLDELQPQADGYCVRSELLEVAHDLERGWHQDGWGRVIREVLQDIVSRRRNQILAHYRREAPERARRIESRLNRLRQDLERAIAEIAEEIATGRSLVMAPRKRTGLDDGVAVSTC